MTEQTNTQIAIKPLRKEDYSKAQHFAIEGMHLNWYTDNPFFLELYSKYFWHKELNQASHVYGAYVGERFVGVLLASLNGSEKKYQNRLRTGFLKFFEWLQGMVIGGGTDQYDTANQDMLDKVAEKERLDGEILFLAADPKAKIKGIGTALLKAFEQDASNKTIYLFTDSGCTYQFYEKRGFTRAQDKDIMVEIGKKQVPLTCMLYIKRMKEDIE